MVRVVYIAAVLLLFGLGFVYGHQAGQVLGPSCDIAQIVNAQVIAIHKIESERVAYVMRAENSCLVLVTTARFPLYAVGENLRLRGEVQSIEDFPPELAGYAGYLARKGLSGTMRYPTIEDPASSLRQGFGRQAPGAGPTVRQSLRDRVVKIFPEPEASAVLAMVLGQAGTLPEDTVEDFRRVGVSHILAISGMNLSLLTAAILAVSFLLPIGTAARTILVVAAMWLYVWLIVFPVSAVRAAWFWTFALSALQLKLLIGLPTVFVLAAATMVTVDPRIILDIGFQLSVSAVAGMWLASFLTPPHFQPSPRLRPAGAQAFRIPQWLRLTILATVGATITTWPIVAYHFGIVSLVSVFANVLIVPPVSAFMILSLLAIAISFLPLAAVSLGFSVRMLWQWMTGVAKVLASWPGAALTEVSLPGWFLPIYYVAIAALAVMLLKWQKRSWREMWA